LVDAITEAIKNVDNNQIFFAYLGVLWKAHLH
jgi:hypothetical protein